MSSSDPSGFYRNGSPSVITTTMSDHPRFDDRSSKAMAVSKNLLVSAIFFLLVVVLFVFLLHLYAKWRWGSNSAASRRARSRIVFVSDHDHAAAPRRGLDLSVIESLPLRVYNSEDFKEGIECAVCLSEVTDGEKVRLLPKCNHGFHVECIDMWFSSHSTCPLCRNAVGKQEADVASPPEEISIERHVTEASSLPINALFWGNQDQMSTGGRGAARGEMEEAATTSSLASGSSSSIKSEGMLVIDIPRRVITADDMKSPAASTTTPTPTRLASLRRFLSREKKVGHCSSSCSSPCGGDDIEKGITGVVHKTNDTDFDL